MRLLALVLLCACGNASAPTPATSNEPKIEEEVVTETRFEATSEVPSHKELISLLVRSPLSLEEAGDCAFNNGKTEYDLGVLVRETLGGNDEKTTCEVSVGGFVCTTTLAQTEGEGEYMVRFSYKVSADKKAITELIDCMMAG